MPKSKRTRPTLCANGGIFSPSSGNNAASSETNPNCFELEFKDLQTWLKKSQQSSFPEWVLVSLLFPICPVHLCFLSSLYFGLFFFLSFKLFTEAPSGTSCHHQSVCHTGISKNNVFFKGYPRPPNLQTMSSLSTRSSQTENRAPILYIIMKNLE